LTLFPADMPEICGRALTTVHDWPREGFLSRDYNHQAIGMILASLVDGDCTKIRISMEDRKL